MYIDKDEEIIGKNDDFTPPQYLFSNNHPDFSIFPPKILNRYLTLP